MKKQLFILGLLSLFIFSSCKIAPKITFDYDSTYDFSKTKSFKLLEKESTTGSKNASKKYPSLMKQRIQRLVKEELIIAGLYENIKEPSFLVRFSINAVNKVKSESYFSTYNTPYYYGSHGNYYGHGYNSYYYDDYYSSSSLHSTNYSYYSERSLIIEFIDPKEKRVIWEGKGIFYFDSGITTSEKNNKLRIIIQKILSYFPPNEYLGEIQNMNNDF